MGNFFSALAAVFAAPTTWWLIGSGACVSGTCALLIWILDRPGRYRG